MSRKVLVVDDEKLIVKGVRFSLEQDGMEVDCAYDGEEALEKIKNNIYDIVLLDILIIGINLGNDCVVLNATLALSLVDDDLKDTGSCDQLVFNFLGIYVFAVGENDEVLLSAGDGQNIVLVKTSVVAGVEVAVFADGICRCIGGDVAAISAAEKLLAAVAVAVVILRQLRAHVQPIVFPQPAG